MIALCLCQSNCQPIECLEGKPIMCYQQSVRSSHANLSFICLFRQFVYQ